MRDQEWLESALSALDLIYFEGQLREDEVRVKWHKFRPAKNCLTYGEYFNKEIRVNSVLARAWVPDFVVVSTVFHETLHHVIGMDHDLTFDLAESRFAHHTKALLWEAANIDKLLEESKKKDAT